MDQSELADRTKSFALKVILFCRGLPLKLDVQTIRRQLVRSSTSVGANYRAVVRARSRAEFFAKMCIVLEEADESLYWLELLHSLELGESAQFQEIYKEADQLVRIFSRTRKTARNN